MMGTRIALVLALALVTAGAPPAAAQAKIEAVIPEGARISVLSLGADRAVASSAGMELLPGDLLVTAIEGAFLELSCVAGETTSTYRLKSPFRVLIDVPAEAACHVNVLSGEANILAESPTQTTIGGVTLSSAGTQYAVEVRRGADGIVQKVTVFDGVLKGLSPAARGIEVTAGRHVLRRPGTSEWTSHANTAVEVDRSASLYARFDLAAAQRKGITIEDSVAALRSLKSLHYEVLANPADTVKRVELAKRQVEYKINDQALYNLKRVDVTTDSKLQRYRINPEVLKSNLRPVNRAWALAATRARAAVDSLQLVIRRGSATAREYFELTKNYVTLNETDNARSAGTRALDLAARNRRLTDAEVAELKAILDRIR